MRWKQRGTRRWKIGQKGREGGKGGERHPPQRKSQKILGVFEEGQTQKERI